MEMGMTKAIASGNAKQLSTLIMPMHTYTHAYVLYNIYRAYIHTCSPRAVCFVVCDQAWGSSSSSWSPCLNLIRVTMLSWAEQVNNSTSFARSLSLVLPCCLTRSSLLLALTLLIFMAQWLSLTYHTYLTQSPAPYGLPTPSRCPCYAVIRFRSAYSTRCSPIAPLPLPPSLRRELVPERVGWELRHNPLLNIFILRWRCSFPTTALAPALAPTPLPPCALFTVICRHFVGRSKMSCYFWPNMPHFFIYACISQHTHTHTHIRVFPLTSFCINASLVQNSVNLWAAMPNEWLSD